MQLNYDGKLLIAIGRSRKATQWQNKEMQWSDLVSRLSTTTRTRETAAEYAQLSKGDRDSIKDVLETMLSEVYHPSADDSRYTFVGGSTTGGLMIYDDKYAYSHHAADPAGGKLCNAFDLVCWHLFTPGRNTAGGEWIADERASISAMRGFASEDEATRMQLGEERARQAAEEFGDLDKTGSGVSNGVTSVNGNNNGNRDGNGNGNGNGNRAGVPTNPPIRSGDCISAENADWQKLLEVDKQGRGKDTLGNLANILRYDPKLKDISYNIHRSGIDIRKDAEGKTGIPWNQLKPGWNESDFGALQIYLKRIYRIRYQGYKDSET